MELTRRESEVYKYLVRGWLNTEIAATLKVSIKTVKWHATNIYKKAGVTGKARLIVYHWRTQQAHK